MLHPRPWDGRLRQSASTNSPGEPGVNHSHSIASRLRACRTRGLARDLTGVIFPKLNQALAQSRLGQSVSITIRWDFRPVTLAGSSAVNSISVACRSRWPNRSANHPCNSAIRSGYGFIYSYGLYSYLTGLLLYETIRT